MFKKETMDLLTDTYKLIANSHLGIKKIAKGSDVGERWLHKLVKGVWQDPGVRKVNRVYLFLKTGEIQKEIPANGSTDASSDDAQATACPRSTVSSASRQGTDTHGGDSPLVGG